MAVHRLWLCAEGTRLAAGLGRRTTGEGEALVGEKEAFEDKALQWLARYLLGRTAMDVSVMVNLAFFDPGAKLQNFDSEKASQFLQASSCAVCSVRALRCEVPLLKRRVSGPSSLERRTFEGTLRRSNARAPCMRLLRARAV